VFLESEAREEAPFGGDAWAWRRWDREAGKDPGRPRVTYASPVDEKTSPATWPQPVQQVSDALREAGAEARVEEFAEEVATAADAARAIGCPLRQIVKSLLFDCDGRSVLVLVPGDGRTDPAKVAAATGVRRARVASAVQVERETGYAPGAVSPIRPSRVERVLIERTLLGEPLVWVGAGSERHLAGLPPTELVRVTRAEGVSVVEDA
jgi:prolyl-tRNA editing enzyme YbaK/EbsC (Cys-tRNA(Pro) deacylase)